ncbi:MAG: hypothetical protein DRI57_02580 [Deltaproteobacteria bacterium]|nr:MAG: hypothetical protein DRI57_02580 [Deltaproteobacteria bacterium]
MPAGTASAVTGGYDSEFQDRTDISVPFPLSYSRFRNDIPGEHLPESVTIRTKELRGEKHDCFDKTAEIH